MAARFQWGASAPPEKSSLSQTTGPDGRQLPSPAALYPGGQPGLQCALRQVCRPLWPGTLQALPSASGKLEQVPVAASQTPGLQVLPPEQSVALPPTQAPDWHLSVCVQALLS